MKKSVFSILMMALVLCLGLTSCGGGGDTPGKIVEKYYRAAAAGDADQVISLMDLSGIDAELVKAVTEGMKTDIPKAKEIDAQVKSFEVIKEEISADGKSATVEFKATCYDKEKGDQTLNETANLVKTDQGWKMQMAF